MGILLTIIWLFFSLPWVFLAGIVSFASLDPSHFPDGAMPLMVAEATAFTCGPPVALGLLLFGVSYLIPKGESQVAAIFPFWAVLRIALWLTVGATGAVQVLANDGDLASASGKHMLGLNAFWWIGLPCALVAIGAAIWARLPAGGTPRSNMVAVIRTMLSPFKWLGDVVYEAAYEDQAGAVTATSKKRKAA